MYLLCSYSSNYTAIWCLKADRKIYYRQLSRYEKINKIFKLTFESKIKGCLRGLQFYLYTFLILIAFNYFRSTFIYFEINISAYSQEIFSLKLKSFIENRKLCYTKVCLKIRRNCYNLHCVIQINNNFINNWIKINIIHNNSNCNHVFIFSTQFLISRNLLLIIF